MLRLVQACTAISNLAISRDPWSGSLSRWTRLKVLVSCFPEIPRFMVFRAHDLSSLWNSLQPYGPQWFLAVICTQMQLIIDWVLQRLRRPCVEDLIRLWESTPAMIRMVIMVWGSKPQFSGPRCQCKLCIGILELYLVIKVLWIPMKVSGEDPLGTFWHIEIYGISCWHDVLTY